MAELGLDRDALADAYRRMVFNVCGVNRDDHTKNFAFLRRAHSGWELAPAYENTHSYRPESRWTARHLMSVNDRFEHITVDDLQVVGERHDVPGFRRIVRDVLDATAAWRTHAAEAEVPGDVIDTVAKDIGTFRPT